MWVTMVVLFTEFDHVTCIYYPRLEKTLPLFGQYILWPLP